MQPLKASSPIFKRVDGSITFLKEYIESVTYELNALGAISVTPSGISTVESLPL